MSETATMLDRVRDFIASYVVLPAPQYLDVVALWTVHTHAMAAFDTSPRLVFSSAEKESGKTRALETLEVLTAAPLQTFNATIAAIFRLLKDEQVTLLIDEVDAIFSPKAAKENEELRALINAGYRRGASVARVVGIGSKLKVERFPVFACVALAAIGGLPDTIVSRSLVIPMRRRAAGEAVAAFRRRQAEIEGDELRGWLKDWAEHHVDELTDAEPAIPDGITDRAADCWEPLLAIADLAGDEWAGRARDAATFLVASRVAEDMSIGVRLLADVKAAMESGDRLPTSGLLAKLNALEESGWGGWNKGQGMNARDLAFRLKPYGIAPKNVKMPDGTVPKGYQREQFADAWSRYLRDGSSATAATIRYPDSYSKEGSGSGVAVVVERRERDRETLPQADQRTLGLHPGNSRYSATSNTNPVADVHSNGSGPQPEDLTPEQLDELYRDAVVVVTD